MPSTSQGKADSWVSRGLMILVSIVLAICSWFLTQAWDRISENEQAIHKLEVSDAETSGNRFTSGDWANAKAVLDSDRLSMDRRIIRLEESLPTIKDTLIEIKQTIQRLEEKQRDLHTH